MSRKRRAKGGRAAWVRLAVICAAITALLLAALAVWGQEPALRSDEQAAWGQQPAPRTLSDEQAALLYAAAWAQVPHYRLPDTAPRVVYVTQARLRELVHCTACDIRAHTVAREVYIDWLLDFADAVEASMLLHEFVHVLQYVARGPARDCEDWLAREIEAYTAQLAVLEGAGAPIYRVKMAAQQLNRTVCR